MKRILKAHLVGLNVKQKLRMFWGGKGITHEHTWRIHLFWFSFHREIL